MRWTTAKVRQSFLDFFRDRGHQIVPSASLIPKGDPTLLFTNAGMVPFKDYFLGLRTPPNRRVADCQKILRISGKHNDLEAVGRDTYHHTFFEMLGNWSFGDYYKKEAIAWHWDLITDKWEVPKERLWATVHKNDEESLDVWRSLEVLPPERILPFGDKDNFWEMGETGPCGPNSEIDIDRGPSACNRAGHPEKECAVNVDGCERFIELANLVFIQYNRDASGKLTPLPEKHVDTGTGLERVAAILQGLKTRKVIGDYDIDIFKTIIRSTERVVERGAYASPEFGFPAVGFTPPRYGVAHSTTTAAQLQSAFNVSFRAIADHGRAIAFLIAEGVLPGNGKREYVVRRLIRRAARHGRRLGMRQPFLSSIVQSVAEVMGDAYQELVDRLPFISEVVEAEEEKFATTLDRGLEILEQERTRLLRSSAAQAFQTTPRLFSGQKAFELYDTYGFPLDLTQDVLKDDQIAVDVEEFDRLMEDQRQRGRNARASDSFSVVLLGGETQFVGHHNYTWDSEIIGGGLLPVGNYVLYAAETPFYPEGGGQVGDRGVIESETGGIFEVTNTRRVGASIGHFGSFLRGGNADFLGKRVALKVDRVRRDAAMLNHSATHILHYALRDVLGTGVHQAGSLVEPDRLRFDFSHQGPVSPDTLLNIEEEINARIRENAEVTVEEMAYDDAIKAGALAFFGDKYGDRVRVVRMGDFSVELCGGTHVNRTGEVGIFKLEAESGVAAGVRRIEASTGQGALEAIRQREKILDQIGSHLGARDAAALERLEKLLAREKELEKKLRSMEQKLASGAGGAGADAETIRDVNGVKLVTRKLEGVEPRTLREMADRLRDKHRSVVVALASDLGEGKVAMLVAVTPDLTSRVKAGDIVRQIAPIVGGSGGGKPDLAQAGGRDASKIEEALGKVAELIKQLIAS